MKIYRNILFILFSLIGVAFALFFIADFQLPDDASVNTYEGTALVWFNVCMWSLLFLLLSIPCTLVATLIYSIKVKTRWLIWVSSILLALFFSLLAYDIWDEFYKSEESYEIDDVDSEPWHMMMGDYDKRRCQAFNDLIAARGDYDKFVNVIGDYYHLTLDSNNSPYQDYCIYKQSFDSLVNFVNNGQTFVLYMHAELQQMFDEVASEHFYTKLLQKGVYSIETDMLWGDYFEAMETVCDSVVMCRPLGQGTISYLEHCFFMEEVRKERLEFLKSLYFADDVNYKPANHEEINSRTLAAAFDAIYHHQRLYVSDDPEFIDDVDYNVPLQERYKALSVDRHRYTVLENKLISSGITPVALNNLRRHKLIMLKNMYRSFNIAGGGFDDVILPFSCTDEELSSYNFDESYKEVYGYYPKD